MLDYEALRTDQKGCGRPIGVHSTELAVPDTLMFPLREADIEKLVVSPKS